MGASPRVTQVLLTFNSARWLDRTLEHLFATGAPVIAVDNASADDTVAVLRRHAAAGRLELVELDRNVGAAARNRGVEAAHTPYVAFCDDDTWYEPAGLDLAADLLDGHPRLGLVTGRILVDDEDRLDAISEEMAASPLAERHGIPGAVLVSYMGGASVARRSAFLEVGGYDPRFFLGGEEETVGWHLLRAGWQQRYVDDVVVHHHPSLANYAGMGHFGVRNTLVTAWLHRPAGAALGWTAHVVRHTRKDRTLARGLAMTVAAVPWIIRERSVWGPEHEVLVRTLRSGRPSGARRYGTAEHATDRPTTTPGGAVAQELKKGDEVEWSSHGSQVPGTVEKKITSDTEEAGRTVRASKDDPQYEVRSDKTGKEAVHKPSALDKQ